MGFLMNFVSLMDISNQESEVLSLVQTSAVSVIPLGPRLYGIMWNEKNFEGSRRILCQNLPGVNQCMKAPDKDSQLRNILVEIQLRKSGLVHCKKKRWPRNFGLLNPFQFFIYSTTTRVTNIVK